MSMLNGQFAEAIKYASLPKVYSAYCQALKHFSSLKTYFVFNRCLFFCLSLNFVHIRQRLRKVKLRISWLSTRKNCLCLFLPLWLLWKEIYKKSKTKFFFRTLSKLTFRYVGPSHLKQARKKATQNVLWIINWIVLFSLIDEKCQKNKSFPSAEQTISLKIV